MKPRDIEVIPCDYDFIDCKQTLIKANALLKDKWKFCCLVGFKRQLIRHLSQSGTLVISFSADYTISGKDEYISSSTITTKSFHENNYNEDDCISLPI